MLLMLILKAVEGANGTIIYSSKLLFLRDHSMIRDTAHCAVSCMCAVHEFCHILKMLRLLVSGTKCICINLAGAHWKWLLPGGR